MITMHGIHKENQRTAKRGHPDDFYDRLVIGIIKQAYDDYVISVKPVAPGAAQRRARRSKRALRRDVVSFFRGKWYAQLTTLPADILERAVMTEKRKMAEVAWIDELDRAKRKEHKKRKEVDFDFARGQRGTHQKIVDKRHAEYKARVKARKRRIRNENRIKREHDARS